MNAQALTLRNATPADLDAINRIIEAAIMTWPLPDRVKRLSIPTYKYSELDLTYFTLMLAQNSKGEILGIAAWHAADAGDCPEHKTGLLLHGIYVDPVHHRQGIGSRLFLAAENAAREMQLQGLLVKAKVGSEGFYQAHGMHRLAVEDEAREFVNRYWKRVGG